MLLSGCANIVPPEGGKKDETAPILLSITPADSSLNIRPSRIELNFNEYIDIKELDKNMSLAPLMPIPPTVLSYGKKVVIKIQDTQLLANTTYVINLGNALTDNHEGNPYRDFVYMFSTGSYFDSLELRGNIFDAASGLADSSTLITLYAATESDSVVMQKKPLYATRSDGSGNFSFRALPRKSFKMFAIQDSNSNYLYDRGEEKIGFIAHPVVPSQVGTDSLYTFYMFREPRDTIATEIPAADSSAAPDKNFTARSKNNKNQNKVTSYTVQVDTLQQDQRTFELNRDLAIDLAGELGSLDTAKVYLSYENSGIEVEAVHKLRRDSAGIKLRTQWQPDKKYTLRLVKGWARDTSGAELPPGKYFFRTKREEDYGKLKIMVSRNYTSDSVLLYVYKEKDSVYLKPVTDSVISLSLLPPGQYNMRLIIDANRNGRWDPGNLLLHIPPEKVYPYETTILLKAGWENEIDFRPENSPKPKRRASVSDRPQAVQPKE